ncbi:hypothetical protein V8E55_002192 [Tylopilus felleus]
MSSSYGFRSPVSRSEATSPHPLRPAFDTELLRTYMKKLLQTTLQHAIWSSDREQVKSWMKDMKERVKDRMIEIQPSGFKYIVLVQISENLNQGGRADMISHWEDGDACVNEMFYNPPFLGISLYSRFDLRGVDDERVKPRERSRTISTYKPSVHHWIFTLDGCAKLRARVVLIASNVAAAQNDLTTEQCFQTTSALPSGAGETYTPPSVWAPEDNSPMFGMLESWNRHNL